MTFCVEMAYSAPDGSNVPPSSVDDGAIERLDAPTTDTNSYTLLPFTASPSTSKKVAYIEPNGGIGVLVPACTKRKSNSAARCVSADPSLQVAVPTSIVTPEEHLEGRIPNPRQANPSEVTMAWVV